MSMGGLGVLATLDLSNLLTAVGSYDSSFSGMGSVQVTARQTMGKTPPCSPMMSSLRPVKSGNSSPVRKNNGDNLLDSEDALSYVSHALNRSTSGGDIAKLSLKLDTSPLSSHSSSCISSPRPQSMLSPRSALTSPRALSPLPALSMINPAPNSEVTARPYAMSPRWPASPAVQGNAFAFSMEGIASPTYRSSNNSSTNSSSSPTRHNSLFQYNNFLQVDPAEEGESDSEKTVGTALQGTQLLDDFSCKYSVTGTVHFSDDEEDTLYGEDQAEDESAFYLPNDLQTPRSTMGLSRARSPPAADSQGSPPSAGSSSKFQSARGLPPRVTSSTPPPNLYSN
jgi:hypothetical protein